MHGQAVAIFCLTCFKILLVCFFLFFLFADSEPPLCFFCFSAFLFFVSSCSLRGVPTPPILVSHPTETRTTITIAATTATTTTTTTPTAITRRSTRAKNSAETTTIQHQQQWVEFQSCCTSPADSKNTNKTMQIKKLGPNTTKIHATKEIEVQNAGTSAQK